MVLSFLLAVVTASSGLIQIRLSRIERDLATKPSRAEFETLRAEVATKPSRAEFETLRAEVATKPSRDEFDGSNAEIRSELRAMRTDLTQIALAVGVARPQATEG